MAPNFSTRSFSSMHKLTNYSYRLNRTLSRFLVITLNITLVFGNLVFTSQAAFANGVQTISLTAEAVSQSQIRLSWRITNPGSISLIRIYRADAASPQNLNFLTSLAANATIFVDQNLSRGTGITIRSELWLAEAY